MPQLSPAATNVSWLISNFVERVPGVEEAVVVSSDGLLMAMSRGLDRASADRFDVHDRAMLAYTDELVLSDGRVQDGDAGLDALALLPALPFGD